jgi:hypothetical protein
MAHNAHILLFVTVFPNGNAGYRWHTRTRTRDSLNARTHTGAHAMAWTLAASWRNGRTDFVDMAMSGYKRGGRVGPWPDRSRKRTPHKNFL